MLASASSLNPRAAREGRATRGAQQAQRDQGRFNPRAAREGRATHAHGFIESIHARFNPRAAREGRATGLAIGQTPPTPVSIHARPVRAARRAAGQRLERLEGVSIHARPVRAARPRTKRRAWGEAEVSIHARPVRAARHWASDLIGKPYRFQSTRGP